MEKSLIKKSLLAAFDLLVIVFLVLLIKFKTPVSVLDQLAVAFSQGPTTPIMAESEFSLLGTSIQINVRQTYSENGIYSLGGVDPIYGLSAYGKVNLISEDSFVRIILVTNKGEKLVSEFYPLIYEDMQKDDFSICEETCALDGEIPKEVKIEINKATLRLDDLYVIDSPSKLSKEVKEKGIGQYSKEVKVKQDKNKVKNINAMLSKKNKYWVAGETSVSALSYSEKKKLMAGENIPPGFEYYVGGVIQIGYPAIDLDKETAKATTNTNTTTATTDTTTITTSPYVDNWDWRDRHGKNWISPVTNQGSCGSCWAFASTGATEAMVNLFFNQQLNLDLSEQDVLSCSGGGDCSGGYPSNALNYITNIGIVDEVAFPYTETTQICANKEANPTEKIKIGGKVDFGSTAYPKTEDNLKRMLIQMGPVSSGLYDWSHAMVLVGYKVVKEGDTFYYRDMNLARSWKTVAAGDPLIGKTVWIFKNSWGPLFGDDGYVYVETPITNLGWTHAIKIPVTSVVKNYQVVCEDKDGDGYYWWGLGPKPTSCPPSSVQADGNDADSTLGPLDQYGNYVEINNLPTANFTSDRVNITEGETISFSDLSTNTPISWSWNFPGGTPLTSTSKNPTVAYNTEGVYDVTLTATNEAGSNTKTITNYTSVTSVQVQEYGNLSISSDPTGATVYIDGINSGLTPLSLTDLNTGTYNLKVTKSGYQAYTTSVTILSNQTVSVNSSLVVNKRKKK